MIHQVGTTGMIAEYVDPTDHVTQAAEATLNSTGITLQYSSGPTDDELKIRLRFSLLSDAKVDHGFCDGVSVALVAEPKYFLPFFSGDLGPCFFFCSLILGSRCET